jgi:2-pyrone-4,6-dicarboxylate lactonase
MSLSKPLASVPSTRAPACLAPLASLPPTALSLPRGSWDTHAHVIGGDSQYPLVNERTYTPPTASVEQFVAMLETVGFDYGVVIQISVHGVDNRSLIDALRRFPARLRGVVAIDGTESESDLLTMKDAGVCGVRVNELFAGGSGVDQLQRIAERCKALGWHLDLALHGHRLRILAPVLRKLEMRLVIDHMGWCPAERGIGQADFQAVLDLVRMDDCWIKLSGAYRMSGMAAPYADVRPFVRALTEAAPDRAIWGTDWPHVALTDAARMPQPGALVDVLNDHLGSPELLHAVLVDNPRRLFGLPGTPVHG